jgi:tetratricopeptide (TPR) repeat protein
MRPGFLLCAGLLLLASAASAQQREGVELKRYQTCLELTSGAAEFAYNEGKVWREEGGGWRADHCAGLSLMLLDRPAEAGPLLERARGESKGEETATRAALAALEGQAWFLAGETEKALMAQDFAVGLAPREPEYLVDRAYSLTAREDYWAALDDLNRAHELAPERADILALRASLYRRLEVPELALENAEEALALNPAQPEALLERALLKGAAGDIWAARRDLEQILTRAPDSGAAAQARQLLEQMN